MLLLEHPGGGQLVLGDVEPDRAGAETGEPCAEVARAAAQVHHIEAGHVRKDPEVLLRNLPRAPPWSGTRPGLPAVVDPVRRVLVPLLAVARRVLAEAHARTLAEEALRVLGVILERLAVRLRDAAEGIELDVAVGELPPGDRLAAHHRE